MTDAYRTSIDIDASPEEVFDHFVRPELLVRWMGDAARLEAVDGGIFSVDINGVSIRGHFVRVERPRRLEVTWGEPGNAAMPPGSTRLVVSLEARAGGTHVVLEHHGLVERERRKHAIGWSHFVARLAMAAGGGEPGPDPWSSPRPT